MNEKNYKETVKGMNELQLKVTIYKLIEMIRDFERVKEADLEIAIEIALTY